MELLDSDFILGFWFAEKTNYGNVIFTARRKVENDFYDGELRIRYYKQDQAIDSDDKKTFFQLNDLGNNEEEVLLKINEIMSFVKLEFPDKWRFISVKGNFEKMMELFKKTDWMNFEMYSKH